MMVFAWCCADHVMLCRSRWWCLHDAVQISEMMVFFWCCADQDDVFLCCAVQIKEMMENARRELQERKAQLGIQTTPKPTAPAQPPPSSAAPPPRVRLLCQHTSLCVKALEFWGEKVTSFQALGSSIKTEAQDLKVLENRDHVPVVECLYLLCASLPFCCFCRTSLWKNVTLACNLSYFRLDLILCIHTVLCSWNSRFFFSWCSLSHTHTRTPACTHTHSLHPEVTLCIWLEVKIQWQTNLFFLNRFCLVLKNCVDCPAEHK